MKGKSRSVLILASTLLVGMLLGALLHAQFFDKRVKRMHRMSTSEGFVESYLLTIQPDGSEQEEELRQILEGYSVQVVDGFRAHRETMHGQLEAMRASLDPVLTEEQSARLAERASPRRRK
tara:strand:- start:63 stop:425 length:363 start_codon:yes stop_codon:yes gene_type:complete